MERKMAKLQEDLISALPDPLIHHILSFLPSTKDAIRTGILSKRWENQWTQVPDLIFDSTGMSTENFHRFIENTLILHECSKINKFHLQYDLCQMKVGRMDPQFSSKIRFATRKDVEEIHLRLNHEQMLPKFLFEHASLVTLHTVNCSFMPNGMVNWECMAELRMGGCRLSDQAMELILSGSPLLKSLFLAFCLGFEKLAIASKSLKSLFLQDISCPFDIEMSCPQLEVLTLSDHVNVRTAKFLNLPSSLCADIDFHRYTDETPMCRISLVKDIVQQLLHIKELKIGNWLMEALPAIQVGGLYSSAFNIKCATLYAHNISAIVCLLRYLPVLEELVIDVTRRSYVLEDDDFWDNYRSDATVSNCNVSHLKSIKIIGFPDENGEQKAMLNFVQFFLKTAIALEKIVVELEDDGTAFPLKVSQELLSLPRYSQSTIIELVKVLDCWKAHRWQLLDPLSEGTEHAWEVVQQFQVTLDKSDCINRSGSFLLLLPGLLFERKE